MERSPLGLKRVREEAQDDIRASVRGLAKCLHTGGATAEWIADLARATTHLPLTQMAYWEHFVRSEYELARRAHSKSARSGWLAPLRSIAASAAKQTEAGKGTTWIDLCSFDGYSRERALRTLTGL